MDTPTNHQYLVPATNYREPNFENENLFNITHHVFPTHPVEKYKGAQEQIQHNSTKSKHFCRTSFKIP